MQPVFIMAAALAGIILGHAAFFSENMGGMITPFLIVLLFFIFLKVDVKDIAHSFKNVRFSSAVVLINFVWTPIIAALLGYAFLGGSMDMMIGFMMLLVTPCTDWFMVFTGMSKGNLGLSASILPLNLVLQIPLLPVYLFVFLGTESSFDMWSLVVSMIFVLAIPLIAANLVKAAVKALGKRDALNEKADRYGDNLQLLFLCLAVFAMFAPSGGMIIDDPFVMLLVLVPLTIFFTLNFIIARIVGNAAGFSFDDSTSLTFTVMARNSPLALAIAVAAFPDSPMIALVLVVGSLIELPVLSLASAVTLKMREKRKAATSV